MREILIKLQCFFFKVLGIQPFHSYDKAAGLCLTQKYSYKCQVNKGCNKTFFSRWILVRGPYFLLNVAIMTINDWIWTSFLYTWLSFTELILSVWRSKFTKILHNVFFGFQASCHYILSRIAVTTTHLIKVVFDYFIYSMPYCARTATLHFILCVDLNSSFVFTSEGVSIVIQIQVRNI